MAGIKDGGSQGTTVPKPSWKHRRRLIYGTIVLDAVVLLALVVGWLKGLSGDTVMAVVAAGVFIRSLFILAAYVFGAVVEDISLNKILASLKPEIGFGGFSSDRDDDYDNNRRV